MIPGPANVVSCPYCGGRKELMSLISGNTFGGTVWSDTRRKYPMLPEVSPIQKCPHCGKYFFMEQAKGFPDSKGGSTENGYSSELGTLNYSELIEAKTQMQHLTLTKMQRWILNHQLFMAYNDKFRRFPEAFGNVPSDEDKETFVATVNELLEGIDKAKDYDLFHAELLREIGRFEDAKAILINHTEEDNQWVAESMLRHIERGDTLPFLLISNGDKIES